VNKIISLKRGNNGAQEIVSFPHISFNMVQVKYAWNYVDLKLLYVWVPTKVKVLLLMF